MHIFRYYYDFIVVVVVWRWQFISDGLTNMQSYVKSIESGSVHGKCYTVSFGCIYGGCGILIV